MTKREPILSRVAHSWQVGAAVLLLVVANAALFAAAAALLVGLADYGLQAVGWSVGFGDLFALSAIIWAPLAVGSIFPTLARHFGNGASERTQAGNPLR
jgi:hypothetical protein